MVGFSISQAATTRPATTYDDEVTIVLEKLLSSGTKYWEIEGVDGVHDEFV